MAWENCNQVVRRGKYLLCRVIILGGGDLASGVAMRLYRSGIQVVMTELSQPTMVRRLVSFGEAMYEGEFSVEGITSQRVEKVDEIEPVLVEQKIPIIAIEPGQLIDVVKQNYSVVVVDARMRKAPPEYDLRLAPLVIGLGPGFKAGVNCHAVVETQRGHLLGRVIWDGEPLADTGIPERVQHYQAERVLRSPTDGILEAIVEIGDYLQPGQMIACVNTEPIFAPFKGVLRGLLHTGLTVYKGMKIGDVDPRNDPRYCSLVSDKSLAIGGAVLEAILSQTELRPFLWDRPS